MPTPPRRSPPARPVCARAVPSPSRGCLLALAGAPSAAAFNLDDVAKRAERLARPELPRARAQSARLAARDQLRPVARHPLPARARALARPQPPLHRPVLPSRASSTTAPCKVNVVDAAGVRRCPSRPTSSTTARTTSASRVPQDLGFAGLPRPLPDQDPDYRDEVIVFLGASYFRAVGRDQALRPLGARARDRHRGAVGRGVPVVPRVLAGAAGADAQELTIYALLDSPSATGAYRFVVRPGAQTRVDVEMRIFPRDRDREARHRAAHQHVPPRRERRRPVDDYRPEVHDSDGLLIARRQRRVALAPARQPALAAAVLVRDCRARAASAWSSATATSTTTRTSRRARTCGRASGSSRRATGAPAASSWSRSRPRTTPTTTSSPTGCPTSAVAPSGARRSAYSLFWYGDDHKRPPGRLRRLHPPRLRHARGRAPARGGLRGQGAAKLPPETVVEGVVTATATGGNGARGPAELLEQQVIHNPMTAAGASCSRCSRPTTSPSSCALPAPRRRRDHRDLVLPAPSVTDLSARRRILQDWPGPTRARRA